MSNHYSVRSSKLLDLYKKHESEAKAAIVEYDSRESSPSWTRQLLVNRLQLIQSLIETRERVDNEYEYMILHCAIDEHYAKDRHEIVKANTTNERSLRASQILLETAINSTKIMRESMAEHIDVDGVMHLHECRVRSMSVEKKLVLANLL